MWPGGSWRVPDSDGTPPVQYTIGKINKQKYIEHKGKNIIQGGQVLLGNVR